jgi:hypothetical protein
MKPLNLLILLGLPASIVCRDVSHLSFAQSMETALGEMDVPPQLSCGGNLPNLLQLESDEHRDASDTSFRDYRNFYTRRKVGFSQTIVHSLLLLDRYVMFFFFSFRWLTLRLGSLLSHASILQVCLSFLVNICVPLYVMNFQ